MIPAFKSASIAICLPGIPSSTKRAPTSAIRPAPLVITIKLMITRMINTTIPMAKLPPTRKWPKASTTFPAAAAPVCPSIRMIRVEATFSARRSKVVNSRMVGNAANSRVRWVNIATSSTIIDSAMLKVKSRSRTKAGSGSTIIDRISRISTGPASTCHWVDFRLLGRRSIATRLAIRVLLVQKIQCLWHR